MNISQRIFLRALSLLCLFSLYSYPSAAPLEREVTYQVSGIAGTQTYTRLEKIDPLTEALNEAKEKSDKSEEEESTSNKKTWKIGSRAGAAVITMLYEMTRILVCF